MEKVEIAEELRVSLAAFEKAQRDARTNQPRQLTYLLAVKPGSESGAVSAKRIYRFEAD